MLAIGISLLGTSLVISGGSKLTQAITPSVEVTNPMVEMNKEVPNGQVIKPRIRKSSVVKTYSVDPSRTLLLTEQVGENMDKMAQDVTRLASESNSPIYILIDSPGGSVFHGATLVSAIEASKAPVYTVCLRICASMAFVIHQFGHKRLMVKRSALMSHDAFGGARGDVSRMKSMVGFIDRFIQKDSALIAKRAGMTFDAYYNEIMRDMWLDADDAIDRGFADEIVVVEGMDTLDGGGMPFSLHYNSPEGDDSRSELIYKIQYR